MDISPVPTASIYSSWPRWSGPSFDAEIVEMLSEARQVTVNILGPQDDLERRLFLKRMPDDLKKRRIKAHKMLLVYGTGVTPGDNDALGFALRWSVGVASIMLGNFSVPLVAHDLTNRRYAVDECDRIDREFDELSRYREHDQREPIGRAIAEMLFHEREIFSILKQNAEVALASRIGLIVSGLLAFFGSYFGGAGMIGIGTMGMFACTCVMLLKTGFDSTCLQIRKEATFVRQYVDYLLQVSWLTGTSGLRYPKHPKYEN